MKTAHDGQYRLQTVAIFSVLNSRVVLKCVDGRSVTLDPSPVFWMPDRQRPG
ncbi:MAG: hypothetical protein U1F59_11840 [Candidatus Competibacteraceae bacterium]